MDMKECYIKMQKAWVGDWNIRVGDTLKVLRKSKREEWNGWVSTMDKYVGMCGEVMGISETSILLQFSDGRYYFPWFVLGLAFHKPAVPSLPNLPERLDNVIERYFGLEMGNKSTFKEMMLTVLQEAKQERRST